MSSVAEQPQTMTMFEWQAWAIENACESLAFWIEKTGDKAGWAPKMEGCANTRCALELGSECVNVNKMMAALFRGDQPSQEQASFDTVEGCTSALKASGKELADAVRKMTPADLAKNYETPFGPMPGQMLLQIALGNTQYHGGQINLIQLLYGDEKFYVPGRD